MWSLRSLTAPTWHVDLSAQRLTLARSAKSVAVETISLASGAAGEVDAPWQAAVAALAQWLATTKQKKPTLHVVLSGRFVRWQLLPWQAELGHPDELAAYAALRFREAYGKVADDWQVLHAPQPPGETVPACAVDSELVVALRATCEKAGATLAVVTPSFAAAFDRWHSTLNKKAVWFGLIESDGVSLGLLRGGHWIALRSQRVEQNWRDALPGMMAQMGIAGGVTDAHVPLYLAGGTGVDMPVADAAFTWLPPPMPLAQAAQWAPKP